MQYVLNIKKALKLITLAALTTSTLAFAKVSHRHVRKIGRIVITVDLSQNKLWLDKYTNRGNFRLEGATLPVVPESIHTGHYRPTKIYNRFRTHHGNTFLENLLFFDGAHTIRTTRLFKEMLKGQRPASGQVVLEADFGQILYDTVNDYGTKQTEIRIRK